MAYTICFGTRIKTRILSGVNKLKNKKSNKTQANTYAAPKRLSFPPDEAKNDWLPMLLDAYFIADKGIHESIQQRLRQGQKLACTKGCSSCCKTHSTIPVYPLEVIGIYWYTTEQIDKEVQAILKLQLREFTIEDSCPFLMECICRIHAVRPLACRHFNVFNKPCNEGEDPFYTRRKDVLTPNNKIKDKALSTMLPFHGIKLRAKKREAMKKGVLHGLARNLQDLEWFKLADRIDKVSK